MRLCLAVFLVFLISNCFCQFNRGTANSKDSVIYQKNLLRLYKVKKINYTKIEKRQYQDSFYYDTSKVIREFDTSGRFVVIKEISAGKGIYIENFTYRINGDISKNVLQYFSPNLGFKKTEEIINTITHYKDKTLKRRITKLSDDGVNFKIDTSSYWYNKKGDLFGRYESSNFDSLYICLSEKCDNKEKKLFYKGKLINHVIYNNKLKETIELRNIENQLKPYKKYYYLNDTILVYEVRFGFHYDTKKTGYTLTHYLRDTQTGLNKKDVYKGFLDSTNNISLIALKKNHHIFFNCALDKKEFYPTGEVKKHFRNINNCRPITKKLVFDWVDTYQYNGDSLLKTTYAFGEYGNTSDTPLIQKKLVYKQQVLKEYYRYSRQGLFKVEETFYYLNGNKKMFSKTTINKNSKRLLYKEKILFNLNGEIEEKSSFSKFQKDTHNIIKSKYLYINKNGKTQSTFQSKGKLLSDNYTIFTEYDSLGKILKERYSFKDSVSYDNSFKYNSYGLLTDEVNNHLKYTSKVLFNNYGLPISRIFKTTKGVVKKELWEYEHHK